MIKLLNPKNDVVFQKTFGMEKNKIKYNSICPR